MRDSRDNDYHRSRLLADSIGVTSYLTSIVKSPLTWIEDEAAQEQIWSLASMRLSERAGRTGRYSFSVSVARMLESSEALIY